MTHRTDVRWVLFMEDYMITKTFSNYDCHHGDGTIDKKVSYDGLSTDVKPVDNTVPNASTYFEMDTGDAYIYDAENHKWWLM